MNAMNIPGFTAEASLYKTSESYRSSAGTVNNTGAQMVFPQQSSLLRQAVNNVSCSGTDGSNCYCPTGCKQKGGTCCCTADPICNKPGLYDFASGGVIA